MDKADFIKIKPFHKLIVEQIISDNGKCRWIDCTDCPFYKDNSPTEKRCFEGYSTPVSSSNECDELLLKSCKQFLDLFLGYWRVGGV